MSLVAPTLQNLKVLEELLVQQQANRLGKESSSVRSLANLVFVHGQNGAERSFLCLGHGQRRCAHPRHYIYPQECHPGCRPCWWYHTALQVSTEYHTQLLSSLTKPTTNANVLTNWHLMSRLISALTSQIQPNIVASPAFLASQLLQRLQVAHNELWQRWVYSLHRLCGVTLEHWIYWEHPEHWQRG